MIVTQQIQVDLTDKQQRPSIDAVQGDTAKAVKITLTAGGVSWPIPSGTAALVRYRKLDGTGGSYDTLPGGAPAYTIDGSTVTVRLAPETMTDSGVTQVQVVLRKDGQELAAFTLNLSVEPDPSLDTMDSKDFVNHRIQIRDLMDQLYDQTFEDGGYIGQKTDDLHHRLAVSFVHGTLNSGDGTEVDANNRIRSDFFRHGGRSLTATVPEGVMVRFYFYDEDKNYLSETVYRDSSCTVYAQGAYARCVASYTDSTIITAPEVLADKVALFYHSHSHDSFRGHMAALGYGSFAECTGQGYYRFSVNDIPGISDAPNLNTGGILEVHPHAAGDVVFQTIRTSDGELWFRWGSSAFRRILPTMEPNTIAGYRGNIVSKGYTSFVQCTLPGYYSFTKADLATLTDAPAGLSGGGSLEVRPKAATNQIFQFLTDVSGQLWFRYGSHSFTKLLPQSGSGPQIRWLALGDSITQGYNSTDGKLGFNAAKGWAALTAQWNGWALNNQGVGGSGYCATGTVGDKLDALAHVTRLADSLADYELITLSYGVNDWKYNKVLGSMADGVNTATVTKTDGGYTAAYTGTRSFYANMRGTIELILEKNPAAKLVVISPINCCLYGTADTNWGAGYAFSNNGTLEDIFRAEQEICAYYGIEFVDLLHGSAVNRANITDLLPDGVHPSVDCHRLLSYELSRKIMGESIHLPGDHRKYEELFNTTFTEDTAKVELKNLNLERFMVLFEVAAGTAASPVYTDAKTTDGRYAANLLVGNGVYTTARYFRATGKIEYGYTDVSIVAPAAERTLGEAVRRSPISIPATGFGTIAVYPNSGKFPAGTTIKILGVRNR